MRIFIKTPEFLNTDATTVVVHIGLKGYIPVYSKSTPEKLNEFPVSEEVAMSALEGSMFGWDSIAAQPALAFAEACQKEKQHA